MDAKHRKPATASAQACQEVGDGLGADKEQTFDLFKACVLAEAVEHFLPFPDAPEGLPVLRVLVGHTGCLRRQKL